MKKILFVCTANWYRSRFAEEYFRHLITIFNLDIHVSSAGFDITTGDEASERLGEISPLTKFKLKSLGIFNDSSPIKERRQITKDNFKYFDKIIVLDKDEHEKYLTRLTDAYWYNHDKVLFWNIKDIQFGGLPSKIFLEIQANCEKLLSDYWLDKELWNENL